MSMSVRNDKRVTWDPAIYDKNNSVFIANFDKNNNFFNNWMMHCHIDNHHANGMALVIKEGTQDQIKKNLGIVL